MKKLFLILICTLLISNTQAQSYYDRAKAMYKENRLDYQKSIALLDSAIYENPENGEAYFLKARIRQIEEGVDQNVINNFQSAIELLKNTNIYEKCVAKYFVNGKYVGFKSVQDAQRKYSYSIYYDEEAEANYTCAVLSSYSGDLKAAIRYLEMALDQGYIDLYFFEIDFNNCYLSDEFIRVIEKYKIIDNQLDKEFEAKIKLIEENIKEYVEPRINVWQVKGKFEKSNDYIQRVNEDSRKAMIGLLTQEAIDSIGNSLIDYKDLKNEYDADNESFKITFDKFGSVYVQVPIGEAPSFDENFRNLVYTTTQFSLTENYDLAILHLEIINPENKKKYIYDSKDVVPFNSTDIAFNFDKVDISIQPSMNPGNANSAESKQTITIGKSDVDTDIPTGTSQRLNTYALVIGNEDYTMYQKDLSSESNVAFARHDAEIFAEYLKTTLGVPEDNIFLLKDAISTQMYREIEKINKISQAMGEEASIIFYYAGHGFPDEETKTSYLMPVDVSGKDPKFGIRLSYLYEKLTEFPVRQVVVILDACFSGGGRNKGLLAARSVKVKPTEEIVTGNIVVLTSSSGDQSSLTYAEKNHGMFTYFLLKKLKETDGQITLGELSNYLNKEVQVNALKINSKEQNPNVLISPNVAGLWESWSF